MKDSMNPELDRRTMLKTMAAASVAPSFLVSNGSAEAALTSETADRSKKSVERSVGAAVSRADGSVKVRGLAHYALEHPQINLAYGVIAQSTIPSGRVTAVDTSKALAAPGVIAVYTPQAGLTIRPAPVYSQGGAATENFLPLQDDKVRFNGQHVAAVIAETFEQATEAARLLTFSYEASEPILSMDDPKAKPMPIDDLKVEWGSAAAAMASAPVKIEAIYTTPREYNVPMEPHACIAAWEGEQLTVWEPSQWVGGARRVISDWMGLDIAKVRVISPYVGGGFGSKIAPHPHVAIACAASRALKRPVKLALTRPQTFTGYGGRPATRQKLALGADKNGKLVSIVHEGWNETGIDDIHVEPCNAVTTLMYATPNLSSKHTIVPVHTVNPCWLRAPGENPSTYALETAMDELAYEVGIDPVELRLRNWADQDPQHKIPWTSRRLREAYAAGAKAFGWEQRNPKPRSMRVGRELIGWGMAAGTYPVRRTPAEAKVILKADGNVEVHSSGADIGTGTYTILAQTAADALGIPPERISVQLGDTALPRAPVAGGSQLANLLTGAVQKTCIAARDELLRLAATDPASPLRGAPVANLTITAGTIGPASRTRARMSVGDFLKTLGRDRLEVTADTFKSDATEADRNAADQTFMQMLAPTHGGVSSHAWSAHFLEVRVDEDFGTVRVKRMVGAFDSGHVYNPKLARSQWIGGMVWVLAKPFLKREW